MVTSEIMVIARDMMVTALVLAGPAILVSMLVGTIISILQTITSIQEQTLTFAPRIVAVFAVMLVTLPWTLRVMSAFTIRMMELAAAAGGS